MPWTSASLRPPAASVLVRLAGAAPGGVLVLPKVGSLKPSILGRLNP